MAGSLKCLFPRHDGPDLPVTLINTAGGITGGDRFNIDITAGPETGVTITTQAAERIYRAQDTAFGSLETRLTVKRGATLKWLPQETILFDQSRLQRRLHVDLHHDAGLLLVEPVLFGRTEMGEQVTHGHFIDRVEIWRSGRPVFIDRTRLSGAIASRLAHTAIADGTRAMALVVYVGTDAEAQLTSIRLTLPQTCGASLLAPDLLVARFLTTDGFALRSALIPALQRLGKTEIPRCWTL